MDESSAAGRRQHTPSRHLLPRFGPTKLPSKSMTRAVNCSEHDFTDTVIVIVIVLSIIMDLLLLSSEMKICKKKLKSQSL